MLTEDRTTADQFEIVSIIRTRREGFKERDGMKNKVGSVQSSPIIGFLRVASVVFKKARSSLP